MTDYVNRLLAYILDGQVKRLDRDVLTTLAARAREDTASPPIERLTFCSHTAVPWNGHHEESCYTRPPADYSQPSAVRADFESQSVKVKTGGAYRGTRRRG